MFGFLQYSIESAICLAVILLPYLLWFRKMTFYQWNRFYLLGAIFFSLSAPLVNIEIKTTSKPEIVKLKEDFRLFQETPNNKSIIKTENIPSRTDDITAYKQPEIDVFTSESTSTPWEIQDFLLLIYLLGFSGFLGMFLHRLAKLFKLIARGNKTQKQGFTSIHLQGKQVFSFFHFVFFDHNRYNENERQTLIKHEKVHIQQWHSLDLLCLEILLVVYWYNPLFHFYKKHLQQEHEYFVDATTSKEIGQPKYAQMLLTLAAPRQPLVGHAFAYIPIKHRIFKLFQKPSTTMDKSKFIIVLPFLMILFLAISCSFDELEEKPNEEIIKNQTVRKVKAYFTDEYKGLRNEQLMMEVDFEENGAIIKDADSHYSLIWKDRLPKRSFPAYLPYYVNENFKYSHHYVHSNYINRIDSDFYTKRIQHFIIQDPDFNKLELLLFYKNISDLVALDKVYLSNFVDYQFYDSNIDSNIFTSYFAKRAEEYGTSLVNVKIEYGENGLPIFWEKEKKFRPNMQVLNTSNLTEHEKLSYISKSTRYVFEMKYNGQNLLSKLTYSSLSTFESFLEGAQRDSGRSVKEMHLSYNPSGLIHEIEIYNSEEIFLRKYRFHYNEAGYCTKKECINREGSVEFSVRFAYEFY